MPNVVLGLATMNAGMGMPGSTLRELLRYHKAFSKILIVDGALSEDAKEFYSRFHNIEYIDSPWTGSLKAQYNLLLGKLSKGDWWIMLDDDEIPSPAMIDMLVLMQKNLDKGKEAFEGLVTRDPREINTVYTPRVTFFTEDGLDYYSGEKIPKDSVDVGEEFAGPRAHIYRINDNLAMNSSPAGRHVVPYHKTGHFYFITPYHIHLKAPELYVYNDCVKAMFDTDIKDQNIHNEYITMLRSNNIFTAKDFLDKTISGSVNDLFQSFALKYMTHGAPEGRLFIWYYNIVHPELNPTNITWTDSLKIVLNKLSWRQNYVHNKSSGTYKIAISYPATKYPKGIGSITV